MQPTTSLSRKPASFVGDYISYEYYHYLIEGYQQKHPTEQKSVFIAKEFILETLDKFPHVSGLRFMYGLKEGSADTSRTIVLMACNDTSVDKPLPNLIFAPNDYLTDTGERITIDQCWELFNRYIGRMSTLLPEEKRKEIPRACFYGINSLKDLLDQKDCAGIRYHFGYNPTTEYLPQRYEAVMEAVDSKGQSLNIYMEEGQHCPTNCPPPIPGSGLIFFMSDFWQLEEETDGMLYEMVHYVSPSLIEALQQSGIGESDYAAIYTTEFSGFLDLLKEGKTEEAKGAFKHSLDEMMEKYLYKN
jgi:hypothetical protein